MTHIYKISVAFLICFSLTTMVFPMNVFGELTGTYSIGSGGDYETFTAAANDLMTQGVGDGGVTFLVSPGNYPERFTLNTVTGTSETSQIIFQANGGDVVINGTGTDATNNAMVTLNGVSWVTFDGINILDGGTSPDDNVEYGYLVTGTATQGSNHNTIKNCSVELGRGDNPQLRFTRGITFISNATQASGSNNFNTITNVSVDRTNNGIDLRGKTDFLGEIEFVDYGNVISDNKLGTIVGLGNSAPGGLEAANAHGIHLSAQKKVSVYDNVIDSVSTSFVQPPILPMGARGMRLDAVSGEVYNNKINYVQYHSGGTGFAIGLRINVLENDTLKLYNNFISNIWKSNEYSIDGNDPSIYVIGILLDKGKGGGGLAKIHHNSVVLENDTPSDYTTAAIFSRAAGVGPGVIPSEIYNNIFINNLIPSMNYSNVYGITSYAMVEGNPNPGTLTSDHNLFYVSHPESVLIQKGRGLGPSDLYDYDTIADWFAATGNDEHSISKSVNFEDVAAGDLHLAGASVSDPELAGMPVDWIDFDIDYDPRADIPGKGADEYAPSEDVVNLSGTVANAEDDSPLQGVEITIGEFQVFTNASGIYSLSILPGDYDLEAFKEDFEPFSMDVTIPDEGTVIDFQLIPIPIPMSDISGTIVGSDAPGIGLEGAQIQFTGGEEYPPVFTDGDGYFETELPADILYSYRAVAFGYEPLEGTLTPSEGEVDMGTLTLDEFPFQPLGVHAVLGDDAVFVSWDAPVAGLFTDFRYDGGVVSGHLGYQGGAENSVMGTVYRRDAILEEVSWYLTGEGGPHPLVNVFVFALDEAGLPDRDELLYVATNVNNTDGEWNGYTLGEALDLPDGFFAGVSAVGFLGLAFDSGEGEQWPFVPNSQFATHNFLQNDFVTLESMNFEVNFMLRGHGIDFGPADYDGFLAEVPVGTDLSSGQSLTLAPTSSKTDKSANPKVPGQPYASGLSNADAALLLSTDAFSGPALYDDHHLLSYFTLFGSDVHVSRSGGDPAASRTPAGDQARVLESYRVYRLMAGQEGDSSDWVLLVSGHTSTEYTDADWTDLSEGEYVYAVLAEYTDGLLSLPAFSNPVEQTDEPPIVLTVRVIQAGEGNAIEGALVTVTHSEGETHEASTGTDGEVAFADIGSGMYSMLVTKAGYHDHEMEGLEVTESIHVDVEMDIITGIDNPASHAVQVYPNPAREGFTVQSDRQVNKIEVFDTFGRRHYLSSSETQSVWVDTASWQHGLYLVRVRADGETMETIRVQIISPF